MKAITKVAAVLLFVMAGAAHVGGFMPHAGRALVIDGDTIEIEGQRIRLFGIDAPERGQLCRSGDGRWRCGERARMALDGKIAGRSVACEKKDRDPYGRIVAVCRLDGEDLNAWLVARGWALAYRRYATDYVDQEEMARNTRRGIWRGTFEPPWEWRQSREVWEIADKRVGCVIKGNIGSNGERIYHVPGSRFYQRTGIDPSKGERWFCSEAKAQAAGWWRPQR